MLVKVGPGNYGCDYFSMANFKQTVSVKGAPNSLTLQLMDSFLCSLKTTLWEPDWSMNQTPQGGTRPSIKGNNYKQHSGFLLNFYFYVDSFISNNLQYTRNKWYNIQNTYVILGSHQKRIMFYQAANQLHNNNPNCDSLCNSINKNWIYEANISFIVWLVFTLLHTTPTPI